MDNFLEKVRAIWLPFGTVIVGFGVGSILLVGATVVNQHFTNLTISGDASIGNVTTGTWNGTIIDIAHGGTAASNTNNALNNLLPAQGTKSGNYLITNGSNSSWGLVTKDTVGLGNVDNTSDSNKPLSSAEIVALALKMNATTTIPAAQLQADFSTTTTSSLRYILNKPQYWRGGIRKNTWFEVSVTSTMTVTSSVTFATIDPGTGLALCSNIWVETLYPSIPDPVNNYSFGTYAIPSDKKSITISGNKLGFTTGNVLLNPAGTIVNLQFKCE